MMNNKVTANTTTVAYIKANSTIINIHLHNLFIKCIALNLSNTSITMDISILLSISSTENKLWKGLLWIFSMQSLSLKSICMTLSRIKEFRHFRQDCLIINSVPMTFSTGSSFVTLQDLLKLNKGDKNRLTSYST